MFELTIVKLILNPGLRNSTVTFTSRLHLLLLDSVTSRPDPRMQRLFATIIVMNRTFLYLEQMRPPPSSPRNCTAPSGICKLSANLIRNVHDKRSERATSKAWSESNSCRISCDVHGLRPRSTALSYGLRTTLSIDSCWGAVSTYLQVTVCPRSRTQNF